MSQIPTDLLMENYTKSVGSHFTDGITDIKNLSVKDTSIIRKINITDGKDYPSIIFIILLTENVCLYN